MKKIKFFTSLMSAAVIAATTVLGASAAHYKGDVDRDDDVTIKDIVTVQEVLVKNTTIDNDKKIYIDMNDDDKYNVFDLMIMKKVVKGDIPKEEVPSLTTPPVTTTTTTTTTTVVTTTEAVTTAPVTTTEKETTTSEPITTTTAVTTTEEVTTTSEPVTTTAAVTTTEKETTTSEPVTTTTVTTTEKETTTSESVTTTAVTTTVEETVTSEIVTTNAVTTTVSSNSDVVSAQVTVEAGKTVTIPLDSSKIVDSMEIEISTEKDFSKLHIYIDNWSMWVNFKCENGVLTWDSTDKQAVEDVTIEGNKAIVKFGKKYNGDDLKGENLFIINNHYEGYVDVISLKVSLTDGTDQSTEPDDSLETTNLAQMVAERIDILSEY